MLLNFTGTDELFQGKLHENKHISISNIRISLTILVSFESTNKVFINLLNAFFTCFSCIAEVSLQHCVYSSDTFHERQ